MILKRVTNSLLVLTGTAVFLLLMASCKKADINFGSQYLDSRTNVVRIDTFAPLISTVYVDSFATASTGTGLLGQYTDAYTGKVSAQSYYELTIPTGTAPSQQATFDSLILVVKPDRSYYGDTSLPVQINVTQLAENIALRGTATSFYNTTSFAKGSLLGQRTVTFRPNFDDSIYVRLDNALGQKLFDMLRTKTAEVQSSENFINYFKGLCLSATGPTGVVFGIKDSLTMRVCYREPQPGFNYSRQLSFTVVNTNHQFNAISVDRSGTALGNVNFGFNNNDVASSSTNNMVFSQYLTSSMIKIRFPSIRQIGFIPGFVKILNAQMIIRPMKGSFAKDSLPAQLNLVTTDVANNIGSALISTASGSAVTQTGNLVYDYTNNNTNYSFDMTSYLQQQLGVAYDNRIGLLLVPPSPQRITKFNRLVAGNSTQSLESRIQLIVYFLSIQ